MKLLSAVGGIVGGLIGGPGGAAVGATVGESLGGGGSTECAGQLTVAQMEHVLSNALPAELAELKRLYLLVHPTRSWPQSAFEITWAAAGGSDCTASSANGKALQQYVQALGARYPLGSGGPQTLAGAGYGPTTENPLTSLSGGVAVNGEFTNDGWRVRVGGAAGDQGYVATASQSWLLPVVGAFALVLVLLLAASATLRRR